MFRQSYTKGQNQIQVLDFFSLRKSSSQNVCKIQNNSLHLFNFSNSSLIFIGGFALLENQFAQQQQKRATQTWWEGLPKILQHLSHQKTLFQIIKIMQIHTKSLQIMAQFINFYSICPIALQIWVRAKTKNYIQANLNTLELMGNEIDILNDLSIQIRGPLLGIIAQCFGYHISLVFYEGRLLQKIGPQSRLQLNIEFKSSQIAIGSFNERKSEVNTISISKSSEYGFLKRTKNTEGDLDARSSEYKSSKKQKIDCEKCGNGRKCECNQIKRKGVGMSTKGGLVSSQLTNFKGTDPYSLGYVNPNNIGKLKDRISEK